MKPRNDSVSSELKLLRGIVRRQVDVVEALTNAGGCDWPAFVQYAEDQRLAACVFHTAQEGALSRLLPQNAVERLRESFVAQFRWNLLLLARVSELNEAFRLAGHEVIFLKGLNLALEYFGQIAARQIGDIDVLIRDEHKFLAFEDFLNPLGYRLRSHILGSRRLMARFAHHLEFDGPLAPLDLHWVLRQDPSFALDYPEIWRRKRRVSIRGVELYVLDSEHELVFQLLSIPIDIQVGIICMKSFVDLYAMLRRLGPNIEWREFFRRRSAERLLRLSVNVLDLSLQVLDCEADFPELAAAIAENGHSLLFSDNRSKLDLLRPAKLAYRGKAWALRLYDTSLLRALCWWGISLPFRMAEHRPLKA